MLVLGSAREEIPLALRRDWMRERHPAARVVAGWDELPVDFDDPHVHDLHIALMERLLDDRPDVVFTGRRTATCWPSAGASSTSCTRAAA